MDDRKVKLLVYATEDEQFLSTVESVKQDGFLEDIVVTPAEAEGRYRIVSGQRADLSY